MPVLNLFCGYSVLSYKLATSFLTFSMFFLLGKNGKSLWRSCNFPKYWTSTSRKYPLSFSSLCFFFEIFIKLRSIFDPFKIIYTAWKVSKYEFFSGPYFPEFGLNISVFSPNAGKYGPEKTLYMDTFHTVLLEAFATLPTHINYLLPNTEYMSIFYFHHNLSHICY